jgi:hypothetical protein
MSGDASHIIDLARIALGDPGLPQAVFCAGGRVIFNDKREIPDNQTVVFDMETYPISLESSQYGDYLYKTPQEVRFSEKFPEWRNNSTRIEIYGTEGLMFLGRHGGGWQVFGGKEFELIDQATGYFPDEKHHRNFIDCIRSRKTTNAPLNQGVLSATMINLANLSYRAGKNVLAIDPTTGAITNNEEAVALDQRIYREGYKL